MILLKRPRSRRTPIGLDLGENGVRAVQLTRTGDGYAVSGVARSERQRVGTDDERTGEPLDQPSVGWALPTLLRQAAFRGRNVVAALNPPDIEFHPLELPQAVFSHGASEAAQVAQWEVTRLMNGPAETVETRHWPLPPAPGPTPNAIGVGVRRELVARTIAACARAGLACSSVDTAATALCRLGCLLNPTGAKTDSRARKAVWGVLDLGYRQSRVALCVDEVPVLVRAAGSGGREWTQRIAESLHLSTQAAEIHKCDHGIALTGRGFRYGENDVPGAELAGILLGVLRRDLNELAAEVKRSYEYVLSCYADRHAADLILVGGGAGMRNLPEFLGEALGIPVRRASTYLEEDDCRLHYASGQGDRLEPLGLAIGSAIGE